MLRRSFIGGLFTVLVTPAIVRAASLMPISPTEKIYTLDTHPEIVLEYLKGLKANRLIYDYLVVCVMKPIILQER